MEASDNKSKETNIELAYDIKRKLEAISSLKSIFKVPEKLRRKYNNENEKMYTPDLVSIGPYHHGNLKLNSMQQHKWHYLHTLLSRKPNMEATLYKCVEALRNTEQTARNFYAEAVTYTSDQFVEMMLLDGCFIIELFFKYAFKGLRRGGDPIFSEEGKLNTVRCNLIMLENQIPLIILQSLFEIVPIPLQCNQSLGELAFCFFKKMLSGEREFMVEKFRQGSHLLDLIHKCYLPTYLAVQTRDVTLAKDIGSATKLQKDGIEFMKFTAKSLLDISFSDGVFEIPPLVTRQFTEVLFANLIALEQIECDHHVYGHVQYFTSYALLMAAIVQSEKDAKLFRHLRILVSDDEDKSKSKSKSKNNEGKDSYKLFSKLCEEVNVMGFYYAGTVEELNKYKASRSWRHTLQCSCLN